MGEIDFQNPFRAEDFAHAFSPKQRTKEETWKPMAERCAELASIRFREILEQCPKVFGFLSDDNTRMKGIEWDADEFMHTHSARLICVEELK